MSSEASSVWIPFNHSIACADAEHQRPDSAVFWLKYSRYGKSYRGKDKRIPFSPSEWPCPFEASVSPGNALAAKLAEKAVSRPAAAKSAPTTTQTPTLPLAGA